MSHQLRQRAAQVSASGEAGRSASARHGGLGELSAIPSVGSIVTQRYATDHVSVRKARKETAIHHPPRPCWHAERPGETSRWLILKPSTTGVASTSGSRRRASQRKPNWRIFMRSVFGTLSTW